MRSFPDSIRGLAVTSSFALAFSTGALAQSFDAMPLVTGLSSPTGIAIDGQTGDLYFSEVPTPGVMGAASQNRVAVRDATTGAITTLAAGEPEPVNLACQGGALYWTCSAAGVVVRRENGTNAVVRTGLASPSGIAADASGTIFLTQVPTPGVPGPMGGTNTVDRSQGLATGAAIVNISTGEPEPVDITVVPSGLVYWTCRTAGVILRYDPADGSIAPELDGLEQPSGIASDDAGNLYFTEVPTPGVPGTMGGTNRVWKYAPATGNFTLLSLGAPEPVDIAVSGDGATVYWTCRTAGVIFRAVETGPRPSVTATSARAPGDTVTFTVDAPGQGGRTVLFGNSFGLGPIVVPGLGTIAFADDDLLAATFGADDGSLTTGYFGMLDAAGFATAQLAIPPAPELSGLVFYTAAATFDLGTLTSLSSTLRIAIE